MVEKAKNRRHTAMKISPKEPKTVENAYWVSIIPSLSMLKELVVRILNTVKFNTIKVSINTLIIAASPWQ